MKLTKEEKLIKFFLEENQNSNTNEVSIDKSDLSKLNLTEKEASRCIHFLQEDGILNICQKSKHNDFDIFWKVRLTSKCKYYFENKKEDKIQNRRGKNEEFRQWITLLIAIISLILSVLSIFF